MDRWMQYFECLLNRPAPSDEPSIEAHESADVGLGIPSSTEIKKCLSKLKRNRAPGLDNVQVELWQIADDCVHDWLVDMVQKIWREESMPDDWKIGVIIPIHKKQDRADCNNYRGISLLSVGYKLLAKVLERYIKPFY